MHMYRFPHLLEGVSYEKNRWTSYFVSETLGPLFVLWAMDSPGSKLTIHPKMLYGSSRASENPIGHKQIFFNPDSNQPPSESGNPWQDSQHSYPQEALPRRVEPRALNSWQNNSFHWYKVKNQPDFYRKLVLPNTINPIALDHRS